MDYHFQDVGVLVKALSSCGAVRELDLSYNSVTDAGVECLAEYLKVEWQRRREKEGKKEGGHFDI